MAALFSKCWRKICSPVHSFGQREVTLGEQDVSHRANDHRDGAVLADDLLSSIHLVQEGDEVWRAGVEVSLQLGHLQIMNTRAHHLRGRVKFDCSWQ